MGKTVLVIEDNQDNRDIILEFLSAFGFDVVSAVDGKEGLETFNAERPDLVLCDVLLPKVNGFGVCQAVKQNDAPKPVILMSALYKTHALQAEAKEKYGADDYMIKPLNLVALSNKILELLGTTKDELESEAKGKIRYSGPPESGTFDEFPGAVVLSHLHNHKVTGVLTCKGRCKKGVYIESGIPIYVNSDDPDETYARMMVADGKITEEQLDESAKKAKLAGTTLGRMLVTEGYLNSKELAEYMVNEVHERLIDLFGWTQGTYNYLEETSFLKKINRPPMDFAESLYKGIMRNDYIDYLKGRYNGKRNSVVNKIEDKLILVAEIGMEMDDLQTFAYIDGEKTLEQVISKSGREPKEAMKVIFTLEMLGIITM